MDEIVRGAWLEDKKTRFTHASGAVLTTDAPAAYGGGASFCSMDLVAAALGSCALTVATMVSERIGFEMAGATVEVSRRMHERGFALAGLTVTLRLPEDLCEEERAMVERAVERCPVRAALHPDLAVEVRFCYDVKPPASLSASAPM